MIVAGVLRGDPVGKPDNPAQPVLLAVYGTLMKGERNGLPETVLRRINVVADCLIPGTLYDLRKGYPGAVLSAPMSAPSIIKGQLLEIGRSERAATPVLRAIDAYEGVDPDAPQQSEFVRRHVELRTPACRAWIYVLDKDPAGLIAIPSGDWKEYRIRRRTRG
jgi:gamma-glutamylcyclotransferase (GGCT)/AIG2-like uncharacterized protein YtfP